MKLPLVLLAACSNVHSEPRHHVPPHHAPAEHAVPQEAYDRHIAALRTRLADKHLDATIRIEAPFVVVGDGSEDALESGSQTVRWAVEHFEAELFDHRPTKILDIFLFHDAASYERGVIALTGEAPTTPYGFYSSTHHGLFMNIATGGGTLVHELVHPYVEADFPNAPAWLNEGLGSLYEQSAERDGQIVGLTNWRLAGLQRALVNGVPSFETLTHYDDHAFYADDRGVNYAEARYLMYYLQEHDLLHPFYRQFRASRKDDPSGYATLVATLGDPDMDEFTSHWISYVRSLRFPP